MDKIPFMDLSAQTNSFNGEIQKVVNEVISKNAFIMGPNVEEFTKNFLKTHGGKNGVGCANGTSAITIALRALDIGPGDEVLVPNHTFFGTVEPIVEVGAKPVLVDIEPEFNQLDLKQLESKITARTKAIIPVHLYGFPEPMDQMMALAKKHSLKVIEDCAQAVCAKWNNQAVGTFGDIATFSFYPGKNLGAFGDAGYIIASATKDYEFIKQYVNHGRIDKYEHKFFGGNFRIDALQAAILNVKLSKLEEWSARRRELAKAYDECFAPKGFKILKARPEATPVYHLYVIEVSNRQQVMDHLKSKNIETGIHYPIMLNQQPAFADLGYRKGQFPVSEKMATRIMSLPFFPEMTTSQMNTVVTEFLAVAKP